MEQYLEHSKRILSDRHSRYKPNRTGIDSISRFGHQNEYDLGDGFPIMTTKKMGIKGITHELLWFMRGETNIKYLVDNNVRIWNGNAFDYNLPEMSREGLFPENLKMYSPGWNSALDDYVSMIKEDPDFAERFGDLGEVYGKQWRSWKGSDGEEVDQFGNLIDMISKSPGSRRMIVSAWNPEKISSMALPPCHVLYHVNVVDGFLDLQLYQRSCDQFLGVPFNISSYAMLTQILAEQADLKPGRFIHSFGDAHFYCGNGERGNWHGQNLNWLKNAVGSVKEKADYLGISDEIERRAPRELDETRGQDHVTGILEQLSREPKKLPRLHINKKPFDELTIDDFDLAGYESHTAIKRAMAV